MLGKKSSDQVFTVKNEDILIQNRNEGTNTHLHRNTHDNYSVCILNLMEDQSGLLRRPNIKSIHFGHENGAMLLTIRCDERRAD